MDVQSLLSSAAIAAFVPGLVGFLGTRATIRADQKRDRFDRLYLPFKEIKAKLKDIRNTSEQARLNLPKDISVKEDLEDVIMAIATRRWATPSATSWRRSSCWGSSWPRGRCAPRSARSAGASLWAATIPVARMAE
jgi:hypothetical protein